MNAFFVENAWRIAAALILLSILLWVLVSDYRFARQARVPSEKRRPWRP